METKGYKGKRVRDGSQEDLEGIKAALRGFYAGLSEHDLKTFEANTAPGYHLLEHGEYWSLEYSKEMIGDTKPQGYARRNRFDFKLIEVYGETAFGVWDLHAEVAREGSVTSRYWLESGSFKKIEGVWKVHILHSTRGESD